MPDIVLSALRTTMRRLRNHLPPTYRANASRQICITIRNLQAYRQAKHLALYQAHRGEIDLTLLWKIAPLQGKRCYFPALNEDNTLLFLPATPKTTFKANAYGILEPDVPSTAACNISQLDLMILPLLAFDTHCMRLGSGSGYYDRTLAQHKPGFLLGVGYPFQQVSYLPANPWDVPLEAVMTPHTTYWRNPHKPPAQVIEE